MDGLSSHEDAELIEKPDAGFDQQFVGHDEERIYAIQKACKARDIRQLVKLAQEPRGFIDDTLRQEAWPLLLGCESGKIASAEDWRTLPRHRDEDQVKLDVDRAHIYSFTEKSSLVVDKNRQKLLDLITQVVMLVLGDEKAPEATARLSLLRIRDFMLPTLDPAIAHLKLLPSVLRRADSTVAQHLSHTEPFFALATTLTLYAHDIEAYGEIARLFDFLLAQEAVMSIYLFAVIIVSRRSELLEIESDEPEMLHSILCKLPKPLDLDDLISKTMNLYRENPPQSLLSPHWFWISSESVLKTTVDPVALTRQSLKDGEQFFLQQENQMRRREKLIKVGNAISAQRRPAGAIGMAVAVAVLAYWLRQNPTPSILNILWIRVKHLALW